MIFVDFLEECREIRALSRLLLPLCWYPSSIQSLWLLPVHQVLSGDT